MNIKELNNLSKILNLHELCKVSGLNYTTIHKRLLYHRQNPRWGRVSKRESEMFVRGLKTYRLDYLSKELTI